MDEIMANSRYEPTHSELISGYRVEMAMKLQTKIEQEMIPQYHKVSEEEKQTEEVSD